MPGNLSQKERIKLEGAAEACPIKHGFHPDVRISVRYNYPEQSGRISYVPVRRYADPSHIQIGARGYVLVYA